MIKSVFTKRMYIWTPQKETNTTSYFPTPYEMILIFKIIKFLIDESKSERDDVKD